jgi:dephospho-CoA kinase
MKLIVLTGGIAAGKSAAAERLKESGAEIVDADVLSRRVIMPDGAAYHEMREQFGDFFDGAGLDRRRLREAVFSDGALRERLNALLHPHIYREIEKELAGMRGRGVFNAVAVIPLYFDGAERIPGAKVLNIEAPDALRIERLAKRDNISAELAKRMLSAQCGNQVRREGADITVLNDNGMEAFLDEVEKAYRKLS